MYHSESGNTRHVAQHIASACDGKLIEITDKASDNRLTQAALSGAKWHGGREDTDRTCGYRCLRLRPARVRVTCLGVQADTRDPCRDRCAEGVRGKEGDCVLYARRQTLGRLPKSSGNG